MASLQLCSSCATFDIQCFRRGTYPWRGVQVRCVVEGAATRCPFCLLLLESIEAELGKRVTVPTDSDQDGWFHLRAERLGEDTDAQNIVRMTVRFSKSTVGYFSPQGKYEASTTLHVLAESDSPAARSRDVMGRYVQKDDQPSKEFVQRIQDWVEACDGHIHCSQTVSRTNTLDSRRAPLPTRCIRVKKGNPSQGHSICLEETEGRTGAYICVSHRWVEGETRFHATTNDNYSQRRVGMSSEGLPKLFGDVFRLAAQLDIEFVWIDSLCIIQDSPGDWKAESLRMGGYYQQSRFTVAGTPSGLQAADGLLSANSKTPFRLARLPYFDKLGHQHGFYYIIPFDHGLKRRYRQQVSESELLTRGWVFQEWLMSRRIVCYTASEVFLQCQQGLPQTEMGEVVTNLDQFSTDKAAELSLKAGWTLDQMKPGMLRIGWERAVEAYSRTKFTAPEEDRIIALAGVAGEFQAALQTAGIEKFNMFVSGAWLWAIEHNLLWQQATRGTHQRLATFPTWSWASIYTQVNWDHGRKNSREPRPICRVKKVIMAPPRHLGQLDSIVNTSDIVPEASEGLVVTSYGHDDDDDNDDDGQSQQRVAAIKENFAVLYISGKLHPVFVGPLLQEGEHRVVTARVSGHTQEFGWDCWRVVTLPGSREVPSGWVSIEHPDLQDTAAIQGGGVIYALFIMADDDVEDGFAFFGNILPRHTVYHVLLVRRVERLLDGFERIGVGRLFGPEAHTAFGKARERILNLV
ncbi:hypothetical protein QBC37DRAFT_149280 [Rhypophila decipiens]|uniref:Heterokaryon incompatibility domain-containing protein n=1 Tax=Rhypophila decipiens TaxID=261697 RepID=A0AAN7B162_9PEZI|nr:hypothetical protein QBC37DRAFT_149280 [Rhypophila decipiens]